MSRLALSGALAAAAVWAGIAAPSSPFGAAAEKKVSVNPSELPPAIRKAIETALPGAEIVAIEKEVEGETPGRYDFELRSGGTAFEVEVSPEGEVIEMKELPTRAPTAARATKESTTRKKSMKAVAKSAEKKWTTSFGQEHCTFASTGRNRFCILEPGYRLVLESSGEKMVITVLDETKVVAGVETRVVEERETKDGKLVEVSRNFLAICKDHGDVFYFGEEVDDYEDGKITGHGGAWRADEKDSKPGIIMPGTVLLGARYYQEISPGGMDRAEVMRDDVTMKTPAGTFKDCVRIQETSALDPAEKGYKTYAPGVGLIQDEDLKLTSHGMVKPEGAPEKQ